MGLIRERQIPLFTCICRVRRAQWYSARDPKRHDGSIQEQLLLCAADDRQAPSAPRVRASSTRLCTTSCALAP